MKFVLGGILFLTVALPGMVVALVPGTADLSVDQDPMKLFSGGLSVIATDPYLSGVGNLGSSGPKKLSYTIDGTVDQYVTNTASGSLLVPFKFGSLALNGTWDDENPPRDHSASTIWGGSFGLLLRPYRNQNLSFSGSYNQNYSQSPSPISTEAFMLSDPNYSDPLYDNDGTNSTNAMVGFQYDLGTSLFHFSFPINGIYQYTDSATPSQNPGVTDSRTTFYQAGFEPRFELELPKWVGGIPTIGAAAGASYQKLFFDQDFPSGSPNTNQTAVIQRVGTSGWVGFREDWRGIWILTGALRVDSSETLPTEDGASYPAISLSPVLYSVDLQWMPKAGSEADLSFSRIFNIPSIGSMVPSVPQSGYLNQISTDLITSTGYQLQLTGGLALGTTAIGAKSSVIYMEHTQVTLPDGVVQDGGPSFDGTAGLSVSCPVARLPLRLGKAQLTGEYDFSRYQFLSGYYAGDLQGGIPVHQLVGSVEWDPDKNFKIQADGTYLSPFYMSGDENNSGPQLGPIFVCNSSVSYSFGLKYRWLIRLYGKNLTDERLSTGDSSGNWTPAPGRTFGAEVKLEY